MQPLIKAGMRCIGLLDAIGNRENTRVDLTSEVPFQNAKVDVEWPILRSSVVPCLNTSDFRCPFSGSKTQLVKECLVGHISTSQSRPLVFEGITVVLVLRRHLKDRVIVYRSYDSPVSALSDASKCVANSGIIGHLAMWKRGPVYKWYALSLSANWGPYIRRKPRWGNNGRQWDTPVKFQHFKDLKIEWA